MKNILRCFTVILLIALSSTAAQAVSIYVSSKLSNNNVNTSIYVEGLGGYSPPSLGAFDLSFEFNPTILELNKVTFSKALGDPDNKIFINSSGVLLPDQSGQGDAITDAFFLTTGKIRLYDVSLLSSSSLDSLQPSRFVMAGFSFDGLVGLPNANWERLGFNLEVNGISDAFGNPIAVNNITFFPPPLSTPPTVALFSIGLLVLGWWSNRKKFRFTSNPGKLIALSVVLIILSKTADAAHSISITTPTQGQQFSNVERVTVGGQSTVANSHCYGTRIDLKIDGGDWIQRITDLGYGVRPWTIESSFSIGTHSVQARSHVWDKNCGNGGFSNKTSNTVSFSIIRVPTVAISALSPADKSTIKAGQVDIAATAYSTFGGVTANERLEMDLFLNSNKILTKTSSSNPLDVKQTVTLVGGSHVVKVDSRLVNTSTNQILSSASSTSTLRVPEVDITNLFPVDGSTVKADQVQLTAKAESKVGGVAANEQMEVDLFFDSSKILTQTSKSTPLIVEKMADLSIGTHVITANARLVNTTTKRELASTSKNSTFVMQPPVFSLLVIGHGPSPMLDFERGSLRYDSKAGAYISSFGSACHAVDITYGPDGRLYLLDTDSRQFSVCSPRNLVQRFNGQTGLFEEFDDEYANYIPIYAFSGIDVGGFTFGPDGNLYITSLGFSGRPGSVLRYQGPFGVSPGAFMDVFISPGSGGLYSPTKLRFGPDGRLYIADQSGNSILRYDGATGDFIDSFVPSGSGGLKAPADLVFGPDGNLYVASPGSGNVLRYAGPASATPGQFLGTFVQFGAVGLAFGPGNDLFVSGGFPAGVYRYDGSTGNLKGQFAYVETTRFGRVGPLLFSFIPNEPDPALGDFNHDRCVDKRDMDLLLEEMVKSGSQQNLAFDLNGDGRITVSDSRKLVLLFSAPGGAACE